MTTNPLGFFPPENFSDDPETTKGMLLGVLQAWEKNGNFEAHGFPWASEKEVRELSKEGLIYLNRQTDRAIYAKLTDAGRVTAWIEYSSPGNENKTEKVTLPPKARTMRELLVQGMEEDKVFNG
jgi:hypothetical protein